MAQFNGYVLIPHNTYLAWKNATVGNGYDADGYYGDQCWDYTAEFWNNVGFPQNYPLTGPTSSAYECWTVNRDNNISYGGTNYFNLIYNLSEVKQGDVVVLGPTATNAAGHITFADEDYNGTTTLRCMGQNQGGGTPYPEGGTTVSINNLVLTANVSGAFLGAFRYNAWHEPAPTPTTRKRNKFPWVLYARKLRNKY